MIRIATRILLLAGLLAAGSSVEAGEIAKLELDSDTGSALGVRTANQRLSVEPLHRIEVLAIPGFREPVCCFSHLGGAVVFAVLAVLLVRRGRGSWGRTASLAVFGLASVLLLSFSGVYHMLGVGTAREVMKRLDVAGVFVLIAGTITPIHAILFTGLARWLPLVLVWCIVAAGITLRMVFFGSLSGVLSTGFFLILGWGSAISSLGLWRRYGFEFIRPLVAGGVAYTLGAMALVLHWPVLIPGVVGPHELWHVAVLTGLSLHWRFVFQFASGNGAAAGRPSADTLGGSCPAT